MDKNIGNIISKFNIRGTYIYSEPYGCGHINDTYAAYFKFESQPPVRYILQRINTAIFSARELMENIERVTAYLKYEILCHGGNPERETLTVVKTNYGNNYYEEKDGTCWRVYLFIEDTVALQSVDSPETFYQAGKAFGHFQKQLSGFDATVLHEIIPDFHNTYKRFTDLEDAIQKDSAGRVSSVLPEIEFARSHKDECRTIVSLLSERRLPLRVTHNDTKLNNILIDAESRVGICVIDLDTIMPGSALYDFGDSIRFGANTAEEDETDLRKVSLNLDLFESYTKGFLEETSGALTELELRHLAFSSKIMTFECGIRFLEDYLRGDVYFKIHREQHNLDRARNQFKLVEDMDAKMPEMDRIVESFCK